MGSIPRPVTTSAIGRGVGGDHVARPIDLDHGPVAEAGLLNCPRGEPLVVGPYAVRTI